MDIGGETITAPATVEADAPAIADGQIHFDAVLFPQPSLSPRAFFLFMAVLCLVSFIAGVLFSMVGAWPVFGFFAIDIALVYAAFRISYRRARVYETVRLTDGQLAIERINPGQKRQRWEFQPYWLRVEIEDPPRPDSPLILSTHGNSVEIGTFLSADEKLDLAQALSTELDRLNGRAA